MVPRKQLILITAVLIVAAVLVGLSIFNKSAKNNTQGNSENNNPNGSQGQTPPPAVAGQVFSQSGVVKAASRDVIEMEASTNFINAAGVAEPRYFTKRVLILDNNISKTIIQKLVKGQLVNADITDVKQGQTIVIYTKTDTSSQVEVYVDKVVIQ